MLEQIRQFIHENPGATNFAVAAQFNLPRGMADRYLEYLEDSGSCFLDRPAEVCTGCPPKPAARTPAESVSRLNELADQARARRSVAVEPVS